MGNAASAAPPRSPLFAPIETAQSSASGKPFKDAAPGKRPQVEQRRKQQAAARATATFSSSSEDDDSSVSCSARAQLRRAMEVTESLTERARVMEQQVMVCSRVVMAVSCVMYSRGCKRSCDNAACLWYGAVGHTMLPAKCKAGALGKGAAAGGNGK